MKIAAQNQNGNFDRTTDRDLPEGWAETRLANIVSKLVDGSHNPPPKGSKGRPMLSARNIGDGKLLLSEGYRLISEREFKAEHARTQVAPGDVLLTIVGSIGRSLLVPEGEEVFALQRSVAVMTPVLVDPSFLTYNLRSPDSQSFFEEHGAGTAQKGVYLRTLSNMSLLLAPLAEQHRIVAKVEELFEHVSASRYRLANVQFILKQFRQSVLAAACSGRLTADWRHDDGELSELPSSWRWQPVEELLTKGGIFDGPFGSNLKTADYAAEGVRVIRMQNIGWLKFLGSKQSFISAKKYESLKRHTVGAGDIIFSSFIEDQIRSCVLPTLPTKAIAKADCFCIRPDLKLIDRHYLVLQLCSRESYEALRESIHGATRPRVNTTQVRAMAVRVCPPLEQQEIVRRVDALFTLADAIEMRLNTASKRADKLTQAILAKAFRGELVPTEAELAKREGREYEPASALLERIRVERETKEASAANTDRRRRLGERRASRL
jgi:type I restriction enzyme S subunit